VKKEDIKVKGIYKCLTNGVIFEVIDVNEKRMKWKPLNKKKYEGHVFNDELIKIRLCDIVELKKYEKD
jgi:hypothetical protein